MLVAYFSLDLTPRVYFTFVANAFTADDVTLNQGDMELFLS